MARFYGLIKIVLSTILVYFFLTKIVLRWHDFSSKKIHWNRATSARF